MPMFNIKQNDKKSTKGSSPEKEKRKAINRDT